MRFRKGQLVHSVAAAQRRSLGYGEWSKYAHEPENGIVVYAHPEERFYTVNFRTAEGGSYAESFFPYELEPVRKK